MTWGWTMTGRYNGTRQRYQGKKYPTFYRLIWKKSTIRSHILNSYLYQSNHHLKQQVSIQIFFKKKYVKSLLTSVLNPYQNKGSDSTEFFELENLQQDQETVCAYVLENLKEHFDNPQAFTPLRLTVRGKAGSGKSTLIKTIVTAVRRICGYNDSVHVCGPTGSAAFNAGGSTCHHMFHIRVRSKEPQKISAQNFKKLKQKLHGTKVLIFDERSLIPAELLGTLEHRCRQVNRQIFFEKIFVHTQIICFITSGCQSGAQSGDGLGRNTYCSTHRR